MVNFSSVWKPALLIIIFAGITAFLFSNMNQLPSPIYGGDVFYHYGVVKHIFDGNSPMENSQYAGETAHYPWLMHFVVAWSAKLIGTDSPFKTAIMFPVVMTILAGIISWILARKLFGDVIISLLFMSVFTAGMLVPMLTATSFTVLITFPLFVLLAYFYSDTKAKCVLVGIALGLLGLSQVAALAGGIIFLVLLSLYRLLSKQSSVKEEFLKLFVIFYIGGTISLLFWGPPIIKYHLQTPNRWSSYVAAGEHIGFSDIFAKFKLLFFNTSTIASATVSILALLGLVLSIVKYKKERLVLPLLLLMTAFIGFIHPMITLPLLNISIGSYGFDIIFLLAMPLLAISAFYLMLPKNSPDLVASNNVDRKGQKVRLLVSALGMIFISFMIWHTLDTFNKDRWTEAGRSDSGFMRDILNMTSYLDNSEKGTILPISEESGFAVNAVSGKKVVYARRTHTSPFVDANVRIADAAVMMFGNNSETRNALLNKYDVKYFYADQYGLQSMAQCYFEWENITGDMSFLCLRTSKEYAQYLTDNGIEWKLTQSRLDPASAVAPKFEVLVIKPNPIQLLGKVVYDTSNAQLSKIDGG